MSDVPDRVEQRRLTFPPSYRLKRRRLIRSLFDRTRDDVRTVLEDVPGVGAETRRALLRRFGSVENVRAASTADLTDVPGVGEKTAQSIRERL